MKGRIFSWHKKVWEHQQDMCIEDFSVILNRILIFVEPGYGIEDILVNLNSMLKDISMNLNRILRISWSASLILVLYLSCIAIVAPVQPSGRDLILWRIKTCYSTISKVSTCHSGFTWRSMCMMPALSPVSP